MSVESRLTPAQALIEGAKRVAGYYLEATIIESSCPEPSQLPEYQRPMNIKNRWGVIEAGFLQKATQLGVLDQVKLCLMSRELSSAPKAPPPSTTFRYPFTDSITPETRAELWQKAVNLMPEMVNDNPLRQIRFSST